MMGGLVASTPSRLITSPFRAAGRAGGKGQAQSVSVRIGGDIAERNCFIFRIQEGDMRSPGRKVMRLTFRREQ